MVKKSDKRASSDDGDLDDGKGHDPADDDELEDTDTGDADDDSDDDADDSDEDGAGSKGKAGKAGKPKETNEERLERERDEAKAQRRAAERENRKLKAENTTLKAAAGSSNDDDPDEVAQRLQTTQQQRDSAYQKLREGQKRDAVSDYLTEKKLLGEYAGSVKYIVPTLSLSDEDLDDSTEMYDEEALRDAAALACRDFVKENPRTTRDQQGSGAGGAPPRNNGGGAQTEAELAEMKAKYPRTYARVGVR